MSPELQCYFGPFRLDCASDCLWRDDELIALPPKPGALLTCLVTHAGEVVTKETLLDAVWPETVVTEGVLKTYMRQIRQVLGETARAPRFIETLPRRGYRFIAPVTTSGLSAPPTPPALLAPTGQPAMFDSAAMLTSEGMEPDVRLVGRDSELSQLQASFAQACRGERQVVVITGEAGIGKTTLVDAFVTQMELIADVRIGRGQCIEQYGAGEPYLPLLEALGRLGRGPQGATLVDTLRQQAPSWLVHLPALVTPEESAALQMRVGSATRERMLRELAEAIETLTAVSPLILVLEDLHWSDVSTVEWLAYVARRRDPARLFVLGTYRSVEAIMHNHPVRTVAQELLRQGQGGHLALGYLTEASVTTYLTQRFGDTLVPAHVSRLLHHRTRGHPLFLATLIDDVIRQGGLAELEARWGRSGEPESMELEVPESIRHMIERQLEQLTPEDQTLLEAASVAGIEFAAVTVAATVDDAVETIETRYNALARQGLFVHVRDTAVWPDGTIAAHYGFRHALYQEVLYERVPVSRRVRWHVQIGVRLESGYGVQRRQIAAELAEHFVRGHDMPRAVICLRQAAENAMRRYAVEEALEHYTQALEIVAAGGLGAEDASVIDLYIQRGRLYAQTGTIAQARADFEAALDAARTAGNRAHELQALYALGSYGWAIDYQKAILLFEAALPLAEALDDIANQIRILSRMSVLYTNQLQLAEAFDYGYRALALARDLGDERVLALAMDSIEVAAAFIGDFNTLDEIAPQLVALHRHHDEPWYLQFALYQWCYVAIGGGRWDDAIAQLEEVLAINRRIGDRGSEPIYRSTLSWVYRSRGAYQQAWVYGKQSVAQSEALGNAESTAWNAACLGWTLLDMYALEEAVRHLKRGMEAAEGSKVLSHVLRCAGPLAWAYWLLGDAESAQTLAAQAEALCHQLTAPPDRAFVQGIHAYVAIAWVHLARGEAEHALQLLAPVLAAAETCGWQEAMAYGSLVVGQSLAACGHASGAESALQQALQVTRRVSLPAVAWKTHAALAHYYRGRQRLDAAACHQAQAQTIIEQLASTLDDAAIRQAFLSSARLQLGKLTNVNTGIID